MALSGGRVQRFSSKKALELILGDSCSSDDELTDTDAASSDFLPSENVSEEDDNIETVPTTDDDSGEEIPQQAVSSGPQPSASTTPASRGGTRVHGLARGRGARGRGRGRGQQQGISADGNSSVPPANTMTARSGRTWKLTAPPATVKRCPANIVREKFGPRNAALNATSMNDIFKAFISDDIVQLIVKHTNEEGEKTTKMWNEKHPGRIMKFEPTCDTEIWALIGLMILRGIYRGYREPVKDLWIIRSGRPIFTATMSRNRFELLLRILRFDDKSSRDERLKSDNFAAIREVFDIFNDRCRDNCALSSRVTIDETLRKFRGNCKFRLYMPQKPGKYGLLFHVLTNATHRYVSRMLPYTGKTAAGQNTSSQSPQTIVKQLCQHLTGSGRTITMDRYYTSVDLAEDLFVNHKLAILGTINLNRQHIPEEMKKTDGRVLLSTKFAWSGPIMMASYIPKPKRNVLLITTEHNQPDVSQREDCKPEVILSYNEDKGGVDVVDMMMDTYRSKVATRRWPMVVFYTIVDVQAINSFVLWLHRNPRWQEKKKCQRRRLFLSDLGMSLILPMIEQRTENTAGLQYDVRRAISVVLGRPVSSAPGPTADTSKASRCAVCVAQSYGERYKKRKNNANRVQQRCTVCKKPACKKHSVKTITCSVCCSI